MPALGITGGIATGKSSFSKALLRHLSAEFFDADECAHDLLANDCAVHEAVRAAFGSSVFSTDGSPDRVRLRERIFGDDEARRRLEEVLHPAIRARWSPLADAARASNCWRCFDIPLLYESEIEARFDRVIVIACQPGTQRQRLSGDRSLRDDLAARMIAAQLDLREKISRAHHLIWNDSTPAALEGQAALLAHWLLHRYG